MFLSRRWRFWAAGLFAGLFAASAGNRPRAGRGPGPRISNLPRALLQKAVAARRPVRPSAGERTRVPRFAAADLCFESPYKLRCARAQKHNSHSLPAAAVHARRDTLSRATHITRPAAPASHPARVTVVFAPASSSSTISRAAPARRLSSPSTKPPREPPTGVCTSRRAVRPRTLLRVAREPRALVRLHGHRPVRPHGGLDKIFATTEWTTIGAADRGTGGSVPSRPRCVSETRPCAFAFRRRFFLPLSFAPSPPLRDFSFPEMGTLCSGRRRP